jgi:hypothetical protein
MIGPSVGKIEGAFFRHFDTLANLSEDMSDICFLPDDESLPVESGKAYAIKTDETTWVRADFHQPGQMTGPLVYSEIQSETPVKTLKESLEFASDAAFASLIAFTTTLIAIVFFSCLLVDTDFSSKATNVIVEDYATSMSTAFLVIGIISTLIALPYTFKVIRYWRTRRSSCLKEQEALRLLNKFETTESRDIPLTPSDRLFVKQCILTQ